MDSGMKFWMTVIVVTVAAAVALSGVAQSGRVQSSTIERAEEKAHDLLN